MLRVLKRIWEDLGKSIYKGERYERNLRGITLVGLLLVVVNVITGAINLVNNYYSAAMTAPLFIAAGLLILFFSHFRQSRRGQLWENKGCEVNTKEPILQQDIMVLAVCVSNRVKIHEAKTDEYKEETDESRNWRCQHLCTTFQNHQSH